MSRDDEEDGVFVPRHWADDALDEVWHRLQDNGDKLHQVAAMTVLVLFGRMGLYSAVEVDGWEARMKTCPEGGVHRGGRTWCAYCGDVPPAEDEDIGWQRMVRKIVGEDGL